MRAGSPRLVHGTRLDAPQKVVPQSGASHFGTAPHCLNQHDPHGAKESSRAKWRKLAGGLAICFSALPQTPGLLLTFSSRVRHFYPAASTVDCEHALFQFRGEGTSSVSEANCRWFLAKTRCC